MLHAEILQAVMLIDFVSNITYYCFIFYYATYSATLSRNFEGMSFELETENKSIRKRSLAG